jgi:uncharacterized protein with HEPN domain
VSKSRQIFLYDILEAINVIKEIAVGYSPSAIEANRIIRGAFERNFEIVAEASKNLDADFKQAYPEIPWRKMVDLGNLIRHEYARVEIGILCTIARDDLTVLEQVCQMGLEPGHEAR